MRRGDGREKSTAEDILGVLRYFMLFDYPPSERQLYSLLSKKTSKNAFKAALSTLERRKRVIKAKVGMPPVSIYTMGGHSILIKKRIVREAQTKNKLQRLETYSQILYASPWIRMVGISGSCSMDNAKADDDVDFFIITAKNRLWLARGWAIIVAKLLGVHRARKDRQVSGKACLNMFLDEQDLSIPREKKNLYIAHEVVQMRLINMRGGAYHHRLFLQSNQWIKDYFPNFRKVRVSDSRTQAFSKENPLMDILGEALEPIAKLIQRAIMKPHITRERITKTQLWFFPRDFDKKITRRMKATSSLSQ